MQDILTIKFQHIANFKPLPTPDFSDGTEDAFRYNLWSLYNRIYQTIKSFVILYQNGRIYDAFILAGHALETCAIFSFIVDAKVAEIKKHYQQCLASSTHGRIIANLEFYPDLQSDIAWQCFSYLLRIFYPIGKEIIKPNKNYADIIKQLNDRKGLNKEKIALLFKNFSPNKPSDYIKAFVEKEELLSKIYYTKYCNFKHSNLLAPEMSFEYTDFYDLKDISLDLMLIIIKYLSEISQNFFNRSQ